VGKWDLSSFLVTKTASTVAEDEIDEAGEWEDSEAAGHADTADGDEDEKGTKVETGFGEERET